MNTLVILSVSVAHVKCGKMWVASGPSWGEGFFSLYFDFTYSLPCMGEGFGIGYIILDPSNFSLSYNVIDKGRDGGQIIVQLKEIILAYIAE